jgi:hypothetical protein
VDVEVKQKWNCINRQRNSRIKELSGLEKGG